MQKLNIDVMINNGDKHYCTLIYEYNPLFKLDMDDVEKFVSSRRPTLEYRNDVVLVIE